MQEPKELAYFLDEDDVRSILPDWPEAMNLVLCLNAVGHASFVIYHEAEIERVLERVAEVLSRPVGAFAISPEVEGYPTRRILFSEEQRLLSLLGRIERLTETAQDYAINYRFAEEEGLDPDEVTRPAGATHPGLAITGFGPPPEAAPPPPPPPEPEPEDPLPAFYVRPSPEDRLLRFAEARLTQKDGMVVVALEPAAQTPEQKRFATDDIAFREDFDRFLLPLEAAGPGWRPGMPALIAVPADLFPEAMLAPLAAGPMEAAVTVAPSGFHVRPDRTPRPTPPAVAEEPAQKPRRTRRAMAILAGLCLVAATLGVALHGRLPEGYFQVAER